MKHQAKSTLSQSIHTGENRKKKIEEKVTNPLLQTTEAHLISTVTKDICGRARMKVRSAVCEEAGVNTTVKWSLFEAVIFQSLEDLCCS